MDEKETKEKWVSKKATEIRRGDGDELKTNKKKKKKGGGKGGKSSITER